MEPQRKITTIKEKRTAINLRGENLNIPDAFIKAPPSRFD
jgi:hypothetical protein